MSLDPIKVFISYSQVDEAWKTKLVKQMGQSRREKLIDLWHDGMINAGTEWNEIIESKLHAADIVLLLLSADFLDSDYCNEHEIPAAMSRHRSGSAKVIPVVLRHCAWRETPMGIDSLQGYPKGGVPVRRGHPSTSPYWMWPRAWPSWHVRSAASANARASNWRRRGTNTAKRSTRRSRITISIGERDTLDELRRRLGLSQEDADEIEVEAHKPITAYQETIEEYKKTLRKHIAQSYPSGMTNEKISSCASGILPSRTRMRRRPRRWSSRRPRTTTRPDLRRWRQRLKLKRSIDATRPGSEPRTRSCRLPRPSARLTKRLGGRLTPKRRRKPGLRQRRSPRQRRGGASRGPHQRSSRRRTRPCARSLCGRRF